MGVRSREAAAAAAPISRRTTEVAEAPQGHWKATAATALTFTARRPTQLPIKLSWESCKCFHVTQLQRPILPRKAEANQMSRVVADLDQPSHLNAAPLALTCTASNVVSVPCNI